MNDIIRLGISTCPNDTFAFHAVMTGQVDRQGLQFQVQLMDIEELNRGLMDGRFDVAKVSFYAAIQLADRWQILPVGAALGSGVGPLLLGAEDGTWPKDRRQLTLCPGSHTTASLLFGLFFGKTRVEQVIFSDIMPALQSKRADFGVCIHEGRFTYQDAGLHLVEDLGQRWESESGCLLPLGGLVARRDMPPETVARVRGVIESSIRYGMENRSETLPTMRRYARELDDDVLWQHVDLYVNRWTLDLGEPGRKALQTLSTCAADAGLAPDIPISVSGN